MTLETGYDTSNPIELYRFIGSLGVYTYTSSNREVVFGGETYVPATVRRTEIILGDVTEKNELKVDTPIGLEVVSDYGFDIPPPELTLEVYRKQGVAGTPTILFVGTVAAITVEGARASFVIPSVFSAYMTSEFPNVYYQSACNHVLYGARCGVARAAFTLVGTVATITNRVNISVAIAATRPDQWLRAGELVSPGNERRLIVDHQGENLILNYPFRSLAPGATVTLFAGCDHLIQTCDTKFANKINHLGFPNTPGLNPFKTGLR